METVIGVAYLPISDPLSNRIILQVIITVSSLLFLGYCYKKLPNASLKLSYRNKEFSLGPKGQKILIKLICLGLNIWTSFALLDELIPAKTYHFWHKLLLSLLLLVFYYFPKKKP